ncbi:MAG: PEP-CTERM sorting domain-containing protein [Terriglobia bacterium]
MCTATSDYLDPLTITGASVYDAKGKLIPDATIVSQSGYSPPASTPEPLSVLLFGTGLLGLGGMMRRKLNLRPAV